MAVLNNSCNIIAQSTAPLVRYTELTTFVPTISGASTAGAGTYSLQAGYYHLLGNIVFVTASISWSAHTGTGNMLISNLPFTVRNVANYDPEFIVRTDSIPWPAGTGTIFGEFQTGMTIGNIVEGRSNLPE